MLMDTPQIQLSPCHTTILLVLILTLFPLVGMTVDLISPSLPAISAGMHMTRPMTKNMITLYLLGYGIGCFIFGFLSDAWGRRKILLGGLLTFIVVSLLPVFLPDPSVMLIVRFLQGGAIACFSVNARPIAADILPPKKALTFFVFVTTMWGIGPIIGPWIGGYLQVFFGWQAGFIFFAVYAAISLILFLIYLPETHLHRQPLRFKTVLHDFIMMIRHKNLMGAILIMAFSYSILICFNIMGPFLFQLGFGYSPITFGHVALSMGVCFLLGTFICRLLIKHGRTAFIYKIGLPLACVTAIVGLCLAYYLGQNVWVVLSASLILFLFCGMINPAVTGFGMTLFPDKLGSCSAIMYFVNLMVTSAIALSISLFNATHMMHIFYVYCAMMLSCILAYCFLMRA
jgi:DHA1 family bicyclomycin/chloramphenicol resistance-like MFS transporter